MLVVTFWCVQILMLYRSIGWAICYKWAERLAFPVYALRFPSTKNDIYPLSECVIWYMYKNATVFVAAKNQWDTYQAKEDLGIPNSLWSSLMTFVQMSSQLLRCYRAQVHGMKRWRSPWRVIQSCRGSHTRMKNHNDNSEEERTPCSNYFQSNH